MQPLPVPSAATLPGPGVKITRWGSLSLYWGPLETAGDPSSAKLANEVGVLCVQLGLEARVQLLLHWWLCCGRYTVHCSETRRGFSSCSAKSFGCRIPKRKTVKPNENPAQQRMTFQTFSALLRPRYWKKIIATNPIFFNKTFIFFLPFL